MYSATDIKGSWNGFNINEISQVKKIVPFLNSIQKKQHVRFTGRGSSRGSMPNSVLDL